MPVSCSTSLCSGMEGELSLLACEQGSVASCAACVRLESSWELRALPAEGVDEQTHVAASLQSRKNHGAPQSQGLVLTLPTAACCAFLQRHLLPLMCPLLCWSRTVSRCSWEEVFLHSERQTPAQVLFVTSNCILPASLLSSVYM